MQIIVNGTPEQRPDGMNVSDLLQEHDLGNQACAVEVNKQLVPRDLHAEHTLHDGDRVELVTLVGGG